MADTRKYDLRAKESEPVRLDPGFRIVDMSENPDYEAKGRLYVNGFEDKDQLGEFDRLRFEYSRETPAPGLTWKQLDVVNDRIYEAHRRQSPDEVCGYFHATFDRFMRRVEAMPEGEMMARGRYAFTGRGAVHHWLSAYAAHDLWGKTRIRGWMKAWKLIGSKSAQPKRRRTT